MSQTQPQQRRLAGKKYVCPDCGLQFPKWGSCRAHVIAENHADAESTYAKYGAYKGMQQRCMAGNQQQPGAGGKTKVPLNNKAKKFKKRIITFYEKHNAGKVRSSSLVAKNFS